MNRKLVTYKKYVKKLKNKLKSPGYKFRDKNSYNGKIKNYCLIPYNNYL